MFQVTAILTDVSLPGDSVELGCTQLTGLDRTAPLSLVREFLSYALAQDKGYRTVAALLADGYEFAPEGPAYFAGYDGEGNDGWCWDWNREEPQVPQYTPVA